MGYRLSRVIDAWNIEVDAEAERLINSGVPPYDAIEQARNNVSERRKRKTQQQLQKALDQ